MPSPRLCVCMPVEPRAPVVCVPARLFLLTFRALPAPANPPLHPCYPPPHPGVPKLSKNPSEEHCGTVRILQPSTTGLPFAASLEFVCPCGDDHHDEHEGHHTHAEARHDIVELVRSGALLELHN